MNLLFPNRHSLVSWGWPGAPAGGGDAVRFLRGQKKPVWVRLEMGWKPAPWEGGELHMAKGRRRKQMVQVGGMKLVWARLRLCLGLTGFREPGLSGQKRAGTSQPKGRIGHLTW